MKIFHLVSFKDLYNGNPNSDSIKNYSLLSKLGASFHRNLRIYAYEFRFAYFTIGIQTKTMTEGPNRQTLGSSIHDKSNPLSWGLGSDPSFLKLVLLGKILLIR